MTKAKGISTGAAAAMGTAAAAAVASAATYWFYGSKAAAKHRKTAAGWMLKARKEALSAIEATVKKAGDIDKETYMNIVEGMLKRYSKVAGVTASEIREMASEMKQVWNHMQKARKSSAATVAKKVVKRVVKKAKKAANKARR